MNIIFMGTPEFAVPSLEILLKSKHKISAVVTMPDKPKGRGLKLSESAVKFFALQKGLKVIQPVKLNDENFVNELKSVSPDLIVVVAFRILPKEVYVIPKFGSFNLHSSLLPKYRGAAPINWAIINGDHETGVTTFFLQDKVDTGNIIIQEKCEILAGDDAGSLHDKLALLGAEAVLSTVNLIEEAGGSVPVYKQDDSTASGAPKIFKDDCRIEWNKTAEKNYDFIRGLSPYPGAYSLLDSKTIKIFKTKIYDSLINNKPGSIILLENNLIVKCTDKPLEILELQLEGKKRMNIREFLNGYKNLIISANKFDS